MTHDELLAEIDKELEITHWEAWHEGARALRAVVELHKPLEESPYCEQCCTMGVEYPCSTIQAIEKEFA